MRTYEWLDQDFKRIDTMISELEKLRDSRLLITGATGLIGSMLCRAVSILSVKNNWNLKIIGMVRNEQKAKEVLEDVLTNDNISFIEQDISKEIVIEEHVDFIIHTACPTKSNYFLMNPVETIQDIVGGTEKILRFARSNQCKSVVYLSSMEVYGQVLHENLLSVKDIGYLDPLKLRNCYPEGKRTAELLCVAYSSEYNVPVKAVRLAQTFGPGIPKSDTRVFVQFLNSVMRKEDIVMYTDGGSKRMYLDTLDAVGAILMVLMTGEKGHIYNVANEDSYCSIREMAELVIREFGEGQSHLKVDKSRDVGQYPPENMLRLDTSDIKKLGWLPKYNLKEMYERMQKDFTIE